MATRSRLPDSAACSTTSASTAATTTTGSSASRRALHARVVMRPDGDEITFAGQRGVFNNISLDGGDYNNGFFGEQAGGQRASVDITLDAVKEFQVVATGASAQT